MKSETEIHEPIRGWVRVALIIFPYIFIVGIFQGIGSVIVGLSPTELYTYRTQFQNMVISLFGLIGTFIIITIFRHSIDKENLTSMGFSTAHIFRDSLIGLVIGIFIMMCGFFLLILINEIYINDTTLDFSNITSGLLMFLAVAISEELFFRGYILGNLMKSLPKVLALFFSSILFSVFHIINLNYSWFSFLNLTFAGILLGLPYIYTKSLWLPIALHLSWNFFQGTIFGFNVSGHETYSLFNQSRVIDTIWNGGRFGFEGSIICLLFQIVVILALWWYYSKRSEQYPCSSNFSQ